MSCDLPSPVSRLLIFSLPVFFPLASLLAAPAMAQPIYDELSVVGFYSYTQAELPDRPGPLVQLADGLWSAAVDRSGRILAAKPAPRSFPFPERNQIVEILEGGSERFLAQVADPPFTYREATVQDLVFDNEGRLFLAIRFGEQLLAGPYRWWLFEIDPATGATLGGREMAVAAESLAPAPKGLWALLGGRLQRFDPDTGETGENRWELIEYSVLDIAAASGGLIYFLSSPGCGANPGPCIGTLDLDSGEVKLAPSALYDFVENPYDISIRRRCAESETVRCLQDGRFRAEIVYEDYLGATGTAQVAPARSRDTGVFSFFDPDNWELMVKVLDGCAINGHFWVYGSASTDVGYTLTVEDTQTGAQKVYSNRLGQVASTVTDNLAFPCTP